MPTPEPEHDRLDWAMNKTPMVIHAPSIYDDGGSTLKYVVRYSRSSGRWAARFEGSLLAQGTLRECIDECESQNHLAIAELAEDDLPTHGALYVHAIKTIAQLEQKQHELCTHITRIKALASNPTDGPIARCAEVATQCDVALKDEHLSPPAKEGHGIAGSPE